MKKVFTALRQREEDMYVALCQERLHEEQYVSSVKIIVG